MPLSKGAVRTADVVIVGGGVLGCATAWHLRRSSSLKVSVLERQSLASAATSQAAGLLNRFGNPRAVMALVDQTYDDRAELADTVGEAPPFAETGTLHLAASQGAGAALDRHLANAAAHGLRVERPSPGELAERLPWVRADMIRASAFAPDDGYTDPYLLADAYARAARIRGAAIHMGVNVERLYVTGAKVTGVRTDAGRIDAALVVVAAGAWSNLLAAPVGAALPTAPVRSHYWITERDPLFPVRHPVAFLPDARAYTRPELGGLVFGLRERRAVFADPKSLPWDISGYAFSDDPDGGRALEEGSVDLVRFIPSLGRVGIAHYVSGISDYTPDGLPVVGRLDGVEGLLVVSGCGAGIAVSGGLGRAVAELTAGQECPLDLAPFAPGRFGAVDPFDPAFRRLCADARARKG